MSEATWDRLDRLETLVEQQQATIEAQQERLTDQQETVQTQQDRLAALEADGERASGPPTATRYATPLTRRKALKAGGLLALLFGGVGTVSADPQGQVGTRSDPLRTLHTEELNGPVTGDTPVTTLAGNGLSVTTGSLGVASGGVGSTELADDTVTVAGRDIALGESSDIAYGDLSGPENVVVVAKRGGDYSDVDLALSEVTGPAIVWVAPGAYDVTDPSVPSDVVLAGAGRDATRLVSDSGFTTAMAETGATITDMTLEKNGGHREDVLNISADDVTVRNAALVTNYSGTTNNTIVRNSGSTLRLTDVEIRTSSSSSTAIHNRGSVTIVGSTVEGGLYGVATYEGSATVRNCYVYDLGFGVKAANSGSTTVHSSVLAGGTGLKVTGGGTIDIAQSQITSVVDDSDGTINQFNTYGADFTSL